MSLAAPLYILMSVEAPDTGNDTVLWTTYSNAKTQSSEDILFFYLGLSADVFAEGTSELSWTTSTRI